MNGVLIVKCKYCAKQTALYITDDSLENEEQDLGITELREKVGREIGISETKIIDTRGVDYYICSCGNYSSMREIKEVLICN